MNNLGIIIRIMDTQLRIKTSGRDDSHATDYNYPYEPTDYAVLAKIADSGYFNKKNTLIDYGCGKGRASFFLAYQTGCRAIGVELDERLYKTAIKNLETYVKPYNVKFVNENAAEFIVPENADRFYFFNPFSEVVLKAVLGKIKASVYENPREVLMFFYYPSDEYVSVLMTDLEIDFVDEIDCGDLFSGNNKRERVLIFGI